MLRRHLRIGTSRGLEDAGVAGPGTGLVTYDALRGVRLLNGSEIDSNASSINEGTTNGTVNVSVNNPQNIATTNSLATVKVNSLDLLNGGSIGQTATTALPQTLSITSGMLLARTGNGGINTDLLTAAAADLVVYAFDDVTVASKITGTGGLTKSGAGKLSLTYTNNALLPGTPWYSGATTVNEGKLLLAGVSNQLLPGQAMTLNGGSLDLNGGMQMVGLFSSTNPVGGQGCAVNNSGAAGTATLAANSGTSSTFAGQFADDVNFIKSNTGTLYLSALSTTTGTVTVNGGTLALRDNGAFSALAGLSVNYATLALDNTYISSMPARIDPSIGVTSRGGTLSLLGRASTDTADTVASVLCRSPAAAN